MIVSAISLGGNTSVLNNDSTYNYSLEFARDTSFNSLNTSNKKNASDLSKMYSNINLWQNFCHEQILGGKLDIIA